MAESYEDYNRVSPEMQGATEDELVRPRPPISSSFLKHARVSTSLIPSYSPHI